MPENISSTYVSRGNATAESILARLKRDDPAMARRVINGELSANAAALEMGWRKPTILLTSPDRVADAIRNYWGESPQKIARLRDLLS